MIINVSRIKGLNECRQKEYNREVLKLIPLREAEPLMTGEAYHVGTAHLFATGDVVSALELTETTYRNRLKGQIILEAERPLIEREILIAKTAVKKYALQYPKEEFQVIMPEVAFCIPLPNTLHYCAYFHKILFPDTPISHFSHYVIKTRFGIPYAVCPSCGEELTYKDLLKSDWTCGCGHHLPKALQPHYFKGRADALLNWHNMIWIFEQKTSGLMTETWWRQWMLALQLSGYTYGVKKATGMEIAGILLNKIRKPKKNEDVQKWAAGEIFEREPFLRSNADLARFEREFSLQATEYEHAMTTPSIWMDTDSCFNWNRACYFHEMCLAHGEYDPAAFGIRKPDYVEEEYYNILGIPFPDKTENISHNTVSEALTHLTPEVL
jgi:hypothetical protein